MVPVIALVGRPNVGKSTLFNALTNSRDALVVDLPGTTRDRQYGNGTHAEQNFIVIDTGGVGLIEHEVDTETSKQAWAAINEANSIMFVVDLQAGITSADLEFSSELRKLKKPVFVVANKVDGLNPDVVLAETYILGLGEPHAVAAKHKRGTSKLLDLVLADFQHLPAIIDPEQEAANQVDPNIRVAIVGQPNVGKSTLINRIIGEYRVVVSDFSGTTRDSISVPLERHGKNYTLIDTAGIRRKNKVKETVEKFSVVRSLQAVTESNVVVLLLDAQRNLVDQDLHLLDYVISAGKALVIAVNKWDGLTAEQKEAIKAKINLKLQFAQFAKIHFISALHGSGVGNLFDSINTAYDSAMRQLSTPELTDMLERFVNKHQPPLVRGRRIKLRYAHVGGHNPPIIVIHGNQTEHVPESYQRYLMKCFLNELKLEGTPVRIQFKTSDNPYAGRRNKLTPRQERRRNKMISHHKKSEKKKKSRT